VSSIRDFVRNPFATISSLTSPPRPGTPAFAAWKRLTDLNVASYRATGGRIGGRIDRAPVLLLHHVGRRSGDARVTPLLYLPDGEDAIIVASMGGTPKHPAWYLNLRDAPDTEVEIGRERRRVTARTVGAEERGALWPRLVALYPAFDAYRRRADREIPVVRLSPRR